MGKRCAIVTSSKSNKKSTSQALTAIIIISIDNCHIRDWLLHWNQSVVIWKSFPFMQIFRHSMNFSLSNDVSLVSLFSVSFAHGFRRYICCCCYRDAVFHTNNNAAIINKNHFCLCFCLFAWVEGISIFTWKKHNNNSGCSTRWLILTTWTLSYSIFSSTLKVICLSMQ